eukprot:2440881-Rhodomonas_salina.1
MQHYSTDAMAASFSQTQPRTLSGPPSQGSDSLPHPPPPSSRTWDHVTSEPTAALMSVAESHTGARCPGTKPEGECVLRV